VEAAARSDVGDEAGDDAMPALESIEHALRLIGEVRPTSVASVLQFAVVVRSHTHR
jgi:hypothetical protein